MNTFNKIVLFGLLSVATVATGANCATQAATESQVPTIVENKFYMVDATDKEDLPEALLKSIAWQHCSRFTRRNNVFFIYITEEDLGSLETIETMLTGAANKVVYAVSTNKANVAALYACWLVKNGNNSTEAISAAKNISELSDTLKSLVAKYYLTKNAHLLNVLEKAQPSSTKRKLAIRALQAAIALSAVAATVVAGNSYYDANCSTGADTGMCQAAGYADAAAAQAGVYANATAAYAAAGASALGTAAMAIQTKLDNWLSGNRPEHSCFDTCSNVTASQCPNPFYEEPAPEIAAPQAAATPTFLESLGRWWSATSRLGSAIKNAAYRQANNYVPKVLGTGAVLFIPLLDLMHPNGEI